MPKQIIRQSKDWPFACEAPTLAVCGDLIVAASVAGADPRAGAPPSDTQAEFDLAFANLERLLADGGVEKEEIGLVNVWIAERAMRKHIDSAWLRVFPGPIRPARKTNETSLPAGLRVQLQAYGRRGARCAAIEVPGLAHQSPLPAAARLGSWIFSSVIGGQDLASESVPAEPQAQIDQAFDNVRRVMEAAGGDVSGVNHMWVFLSDRIHEPAMLDAYLGMFPSDGDRPARKTVPYNLPAGLHIQVQMVGDTGPRQSNFEAPGVWHHDPIPLGSKAGGLLYSSGVHGIDAKTSKIVTSGLADETEAAFENVRTLMQVAGGSLEDVAGLTILVRNYDDALVVRSIVEAGFGGAELPTIQFATYQIPNIINMQFHVAASLGS